MAAGEFSVCQFFSDERAGYEYVRRHMSEEEAVRAFKFYTNNVAANFGFTKRVIIPMATASALAPHPSKGTACDPDPIAGAIGASEQTFGAFEQIFGANQQVPHAGGSNKEAETAVRRNFVRWPS